MIRPRQQEEKQPDGSGMHIAIVRSVFYLEISDGLLDGALASLAQLEIDNVRVVDVPGAFELPLVARELANAGHDAIVALGAVIRGETDHYEHISHRASEGLMRVMLDTGVPVTFGVLTTNDIRQAEIRSQPGRSNQGRAAAIAAVQLASALKGIRHK